MKRFFAFALNGHADVMGPEKMFKGSFDSIPEALAACESFVCASILDTEAGDWKGFKASIAKSAEKSHEDSFGRLWAWAPSES